MLEKIMRMLEKIIPSGNSSHEPGQDDSGLFVTIRGPVIWGMAIIFGFFVVFGGWAALAPLNSAALANGSVRVEGNRKTIQHLEGGIIGKILVKAGDRVRAGQVLIELDDILPKANLELLQGRMDAAIALEARLTAESRKNEEITFPDSLYSKRDQPEISAIITGQVNIFEARRETLLGKTQILKRRIDQLSEEITGLKGQIKAENTQINLLNQEITDISGLVDKGLASRPRLLGLKRQLAEINGSKSQHLADIARANQNVAETRLQITELHTEMVNEAVQQLRDTQNDLRDLMEQIRAAEDILERIVIRAPIDGALVNMQVHTTGGVIAPGAPLLDIVSLDDRLIVEARVDPKDIDVVHQGLAAQVRLTAFSQRRSRPIDGRVLTVSADALADERTGQTYYLAQIELTEDPQSALDGDAIQPGMQAEVLIVTGARTLFEYLVQPVGGIIDRALREE